MVIGATFAVSRLVLLLAALVPLTVTGREPPGADPAAGAQPASKPKPMVLPKPVEASLAERIAKRLIAASPMADPSDVRARDEAAERLAACTELLEAAGGRILWGGWHPDQGYDPDAYRLHETSREDFFQLTEFHPVVWSKLYLSTFMFPGPYEVRQEGRLTVLEMDAKFRSDLGPGEYPYPFWHSPTKWTAYVNCEKLLLVFEPGRLVAAMRKSPDPVSLKLIKRPWDTKWEWTDSAGQYQPRVALYSYLFSKNNPHVTELEKSYREMATAFRENDCMSCHEPDNRSRINDLLLLNYPNQALIARRTLVAVLEDNQMPPGNRIAQEPTGIQDKAVLDHLIELARAFERAADAAFAYEQKYGPAAAAGTSRPEPR